MKNYKLLNMTIASVAAVQFCISPIYADSISAISKEVVNKTSKTWRPVEIPIFRTDRRSQSERSTSNARRMADQATQQFNELTEELDTFRWGEQIYDNFSRDVQRDLPLAYGGNADCKGRPKIAQPLAYKDNGYLIDRSCKTIYVMPPLVGKKTSVATLPTTRLGLCKVINSGYSSLAEYGELKEDTVVEKRKAIVKRNTSKLSAAQRRSIDEHIKVLDESESMISDYIADETDALKDYEGDIGLIAQYTLTLDWQNLVKDYAKSNPGYNVKPLPMKTAVMSSNVTVQDEFGAIFSEHKLKPINKIIIKGVPVTIDGSGNTSPASSKESDILFNGSLGALVHYNNLGACAVLDNQIKVANKSYSAALLSNLTYFYPVHVGFGYKVEYIAESLAARITGKITKKGTYTSEEVVNWLTEAESNSQLKITIDLLEGQTLEPGDIDKMKMEAKSSIAFQMMNELGSVTVENLSDPNPLEPTKYKEEFNIPGNCYSKSTKGLLSGVAEGVGKVFGGLFAGQTIDPVVAQYGFFDGIGAVGGLVGGVAKGIFGSSSTSCTSSKTEVRFNDVSEVGLKNFLKKLHATYTGNNHINQTVIKAGTLTFVEDLPEHSMKRVISELSNAWVRIFEYKGAVKNELFDKKMQLRGVSSEIERQSILMNIKDLNEAIQVATEFNEKLKAEINKQRVELKEYRGV